MSRRVSATTSPGAEYLSRKRSSVFHKAFSNETTAVNYVPPVFEKEPDQTERLVNLYRESFLTKSLDETQLKSLADAMDKRSFKSGDAIIKYGDIGSEYFVLASGSV